MDVSQSLKSCKNIKELLNKFPKHGRFPIKSEWHPKSKLDEAHSETIKKCHSFINKIIKEINTL